MKNDYVIVTPAYNEEEFIGSTIESVARQTILPVRWIIVDDGSGDKTAEIVSDYAKRYDFIELHRRERKPEHTYYGSNVYAILEGYEKIRHLDHDFIAVLDADIELSCNYYEQIFKRFDMHPELGIATGTYLEKIDGNFREAQIDRRSTPKALQVFRKSCYEQIGGYIPCSNGGEDSCAEIMARMHGWQTWSFPEIKTIHKKPVGTGDGSSLLGARFRLGLTDYTLSTHPLFMLAKCFRRCVIEKPYIASGVCRFAGFVNGYLKGEARHINGDVKKFVRQEQLSRLMKLPGMASKSWKPREDIYQEKK